MYALLSAPFSPWGKSPVGGVSGIFASAFWPAWRGRKKSFPSLTEWWDAGKKKIKGATQSKTNTRLRKISAKKKSNYATRRQRQMRHARLASDLRNLCGRNSVNEEVQVGRKCRVRSGCECGQKSRRIHAPSTRHQPFYNRSEREKKIPSSMGNKQGAVAAISTTLSATILEWWYQTRLKALQRYKLKLPVITRNRRENGAVYIV